MEIINGFSKLTKLQKIESIAMQFNDFALKDDLLSLPKFWHPDLKEQKLFDEFSENTISNYYLPFGIAPNFLINNKIYHVPMVIEESSVVAAASNSAKFWSERGGFHAQIIDTKKIGQVHFSWTGKDFSFLEKLLSEHKTIIFEKLAPLTKNMKLRGGGVLEIRLKDLTDKLPNFYQLFLEFETCDAMGANFINSILEETGKIFRDIVNSKDRDHHLNIIMCILSNFTPDCMAHAWVNCDFKDLDSIHPELTGLEYAEKFAMAVNIAKIDPYRAVTHNKGIFNGIDAVVLATGNDFRAVEACGHAYASFGKDGYQGLTTVDLSKGYFHFELKLPIALGTVGGLTSLHPLAKTSLDLLGRPSAKDLMMIALTVGLAQNFGALRSLTTSGIQKGHMKMHLMNILNQFLATESEIVHAKKHFSDKVISYSEVESYLNSIRGFKH